jgi:hypothetical protein
VEANALAAIPRLRGDRLFEGRFASTADAQAQFVDESPHFIIENKE